MTLQKKQKKKEGNKMNLVKNVTISFDLDGTLYDLYNVPDWLKKLESEQVIVFYEGDYLVDPEKFRYFVQTLEKQGIEFSVISKLPNSKNVRFLKESKKAKTGFVDKLFQDPNIPKHFIGFTSDKSKLFPLKPTDFLIDDDIDNRIAWEKAGGIAFNPLVFDSVETILCRMIEFMNFLDEYVDLLEKYVCYTELIELTRFEVLGLLSRVGLL